VEEVRECASAVVKEMGEVQEVKEVKEVKI